MTERRGSSGDGPEEPGQPGELWRAPLLAPVVASGILLVAFGAFCVIAFIYIVYTGTPFWECVQAAAYLLAIFGLQVHFSRPQTLVRAPVTYAVLLAQAFLIIVPLTQFGTSWGGMPILLAANLALVLPWRIGWWVLGSFVGLMLVAQWLVGATATELGSVLVATVIGVLEFYGLNRLARLITLVHAARAELGEAAVAQERLRFARDLHDLLGLSLSTVGPKALAAQDAMAADPERARAELGEILNVARHALADVRLVAGGYRETSINEESRTVESILADSDIDVRINVSHGDLPVHVRTVAVAVLRASAAEVLQREDVTTCAITMRQVDDAVVLDIVDDGVAEDDPSALPSTAPDTAASLLDRVTALGGSLCRETPARGGNRLRLTVPMDSGAEADPVRAHSDQQSALESSGLTNWLTRTVFIGFVCSILYSAWMAGAGTTTLLTIAGFAVGSLLVQLFYVSKPDVQLEPWMRYLVLALLAVLVYAPLALLGSAWYSVPGFLAGSALLLLRPAAGSLVFVAVLVSVPVVKAANLVHPLLVVNVAGSTLITGLVVYGLTWMGRAVHQLRAARYELARIAVADERIRFARDLHDLLGLSLSAITLKTELAQRLLAVDQDRARQELAEIVDISRLALADVRLVANGYRELSLNEESRSAESVLVAADVDVRLNMHYGELSPEVRTVLATVLREGVTNVLRHSAKGARCEITVRQVDRVVMLEIVNSGVAGVPGLTAGGSGLRNLSARVARLGGELTAGLSADGTFRLSARVPA
ncbi:sensor histidine kinase [Actinokineospora soli]|uniref:Sensor histidine kinase n=1 Tax=Actinokineospora soli TaxID=1048753 RepID=A0ABW2TQD9_9PSEU